MSDDDVAGYRNLFPGWRELGTQLHILASIVRVKGFW
ncbi:hypothetical protein J2R96_001431 [Bradyrhizobium elkanii]|nr:hypothetical protein [Bradyrhizobium elkanii]